MCWKKMPYWVKGGVIAVIIAIIYDIMELIALGTSDIIEWFLYLLLDAVVLFIIGAVIGVIVSWYIESKGKFNKRAVKVKIKRRRKVR